MSQNRTAIVVDDEPITRLDLSQLLGELGFAVVGEAADGFDAIELCRRHRPDVVLMDIKMPVFDGMTASETIIAEDLCGCVVLLTAFQDRELIDRAGRIGVTGYLVKTVEEAKALLAKKENIPEGEAHRRLQKLAMEKRCSLVSLCRTVVEQQGGRGLVDRAKERLMKERGIAEPEAYRKVSRLAKEERISLEEAARRLLDGGKGP